MSMHLCLLILFGLFVVFLHVFSYFWLFCGFLVLFFPLLRGLGLPYMEARRRDTAGSMLFVAPFVVLLFLGLT